MKGSTSAVICSILCSCLLLNGSPFVKAEVFRTEDFVLRAKVLDAFAGGPFVVETSLEYKGKNKYSIMLDSHRNAWVRPQSEWERRGRTVTFHGPGYGVRRISTGDSLSEIHYLHRDYSEIPAGEVTLEIEWPVREYENAEKPAGKPLARPTIKLVVDVKPATKENLEKLYERLQERLRRGDEHSRQEVIDYLSYTKHAGLAPVAWQLIETATQNDSITDFLDLVYAAEEDKDRINRRFVKFACDPEYPPLRSIFGFWSRNNIALSAEELAPLLRSPDVWIRMNTYTVFPDRCDEDWKGQFFKDLRASQEPLPAARLARLLRDLDDEDFATRERASRELRCYEGAKAQLAKALQGHISVEVKQRIRAVLDESAKGPPALAQSTLRFLRFTKEPRMEDVLHFLAEGPPDVWTTKEAKKILAERAKQKP